MIVTNQLTMSQTTSKYKLNFDSELKDFSDFLSNTAAISSTYTTKMILKLLNVLETQDCKLEKSPLSQRVDLGTDKLEKFNDETPFRQIVRRLLCMTITNQHEVEFFVGYLFCIMCNQIKMLRNIKSHA